MRQSVWLVSLLVACAGVDLDDTDPESVPRTGTIGIEGGVLELSGTQLIIPQGAVTVDTDITVVETSLEAPAPLFALSPIYRFQPEGLEFFEPVRVGLPLPSDVADRRRVYWTGMGELGAEGYGIVPSDEVEGVAWVEVEHFSLGFIGNGVVTEEQPVEQGEGQLDLLFVIDNSCSMSEEQARLTQSFPDFAAYLGGLDMDFHVGVVSTDMYDPDHQGRLQGAGGLKYLETTTPDAAALFTEMAAMGTSGDATEQGRAAAQTAIVALKDTVNAGFIRDDAALAIIVVSDENDYSGTKPISLPDFIDGLLNYKSTPDKVRFTSIVAPPSNCSTAYEPGTQYLEVTDAVGGVEHSICSNDYLPALVGTIDSFETWFNATVVLDRVPLYPDSIEVTLRDGEERVLDPSEWSHEPGTNVIVLFVDEVSPGATALVTYE